MFKILIFGDAEAGKSQFILRYTDNIFLDTQIATIGIEYKSKIIKLKNGKMVTIEIWDTAGQERFKALSINNNNYLKIPDGIILLYNVANVGTFKNIKAWISEIREKASPSIVIYLVGNEIEKEEEREISKKDGEELAEKYGFSFAEASSLRGSNVNEIFDDLAEKIDGKAYQKKFPKLMKYIDF